jgi:hypothetical protein
VLWVIWRFSPSGPCVYAYYLERLFFFDTLNTLFSILFLQIRNIMSFSQQYETQNGLVNYGQKYICSHHSYVYCDRKPK